MKKILHYLLYGLFFRQFLQLIMGVKYRNRELLDGAGQCVIVSNHNSHFDTVALLAALPFEKTAQVRPVAAGDYFGGTAVKKSLVQFWVNALLIPRNRPKAGDNFPDPIDLMVKELDRGRSLILFPEGTRGEAGQLQRFKKGIGLVLAERPGVPFVPVFMHGMGRLMPKGEAVPVPFDNVVVFGRPVSCEGLTAEEIVALCEKEVLALAPPA